MVYCEMTKCNWNKDQSGECIRGDEFAKKCIEWNYDMFEKRERPGDTREVYGFNIYHNGKIKSWY